MEQSYTLLGKGLQKLRGYEVNGSGGYEWFGHAPAHEAMTAYGLMEFVDMAQVGGRLWLLCSFGEQFLHLLWLRPLPEPRFAQWIPTTGLPQKMGLPFEDFRKGREEVLRHNHSSLGMFSPFPRFKAPFQEPLSSLLKSSLEFRSVPICQNSKGPLALNTTRSASGAALSRFASGLEITIPLPVIIEPVLLPRRTSPIPLPAALTRSASG